MKSLHSDTKSSYIRRRQNRLREDNANEALADGIQCAYFLFIISVTIYSIIT
jgi:hypothetical protein